MTPSKPLPDAKICDQAWQIASKVEWDAADWQTFYEYLTQAFIVIAGNHATKKIAENQNANNDV